ncbi:hypothetical protein KXD40_007324 [Peronospora effusa]|uniref:Uncharacterized protein n=1 Tax=Peronospora effusa TaxID=542832 RepID=A0A3M6VSD5_9STRA|nr:hypothetical protein DD238_005616 [Peronospora effusa]RQM10593.1 hypothetical protein DD237_005801 [Peronospora effusa]UIZ28736.1 hypothetical protein KXD40_007324 [Peronospora effusa]
MLRNVLIMASSGIVLFSKEYANAVAQPRLVGSLITAMLEFSTKTSGAPVSYIQMSFGVLIYSILQWYTAKDW